MKPRVLLTGASGFIGRQAVPLLLSRGADVHIVSHENVSAFTGVTVHRADLLRAYDRRALMTSVCPTHILHFAWIATPGVYWTSPLNEKWKTATLDLLSLAEEFGAARFVGAGSVAEYNWSVGQMDEKTTPLNPTTPYGKAKAECGQAVCSHEGSVSTSWGRIFHLYGPHEYPSRLVASVIVSLLSGKRAPCTHGEQVRDFLHVKDVASAFVALLFSDVTGPVNIGSGNHRTIKDIVRMIAREFHAEDQIDFGAIPPPENDPSILVPTIDRLMHDVGWKPSISLEKGIQETVEWWRMNQRSGGSLLRRAGVTSA